MELRNSRSGIGWSKEQTSLFISIFKQYPCLYDPKDPHYLDKSEKNKKRLYIVQVMKKVRPNVTVKDIRAKIKTLTNQLSREQQKIIASRKSGCGLEDIYVPKLWCYDQLKFLLNCADESKETSNIDFIQSREAQDIRKAELIKVSKAVREVEAAKTPEDIGEATDICETEAIERTENINLLQRQKLKKKKKRSSTGIKKATLHLMKILSSIPAEQKESRNKKVVKFCQYLETDLEQIEISDNLNALKVEIVNLVHSYIKKDKADRAAMSLVENFEQDKKRKKVCTQPYDINTEAELDFNRRQAISSSSSTDSPPGTQARNQHELPTASGIAPLMNYQRSKAISIEHPSVPTIASCGQATSTRDIQQPLKPSGCTDLSGDHRDAHPPRIGPGYYSSPTYHIHNSDVNKESPRH